MGPATRYEMSILLSALGATIRLLQRDGSITEASLVALWALERLPESYHDAQASHWQLRQAGEALLRRALAAAHG